ncbi:MAG: cyclic pyranopterin monophosphate synthase MoaC [Thermoguttaceae bacterium]
MNPLSREEPQPAAALSHVSPGGEARMVDVSDKPVTRRTAVAEAWVRLNAQTMDLLRRQGGGPKGDVLQTARIAAIQGAKRTSELVPMCHPVATDAVNVQADLHEDRVHLVVEAVASGRTGVEMEALTGAAVAALTVYDMLKAVDKGIEIGPIRLLSKSGGKSGPWQRQENSRGSS